MRILLTSIDNHLVADIRAVLGAQALDVQLAESHDEALQMVRLYQFDAIVFGAGAGGAAGAELMRRLRAGGSQLPAVAAARLLDGRSRGRVLDAVADDVVDLPCDTAELCARLRAVVRRNRGFSRSVLALGPLELHLDSRTARAHGEELHLSRSEYKVLELLALRRGSVVSKATLLELLYGEVDEPDVKTLNVLMHRLRKRLSGVGLESSVRTVWGTGYMVDTPARTAVAPRREPLERLFAGVVTAH